MTPMLVGAGAALVAFAGLRMLVPNNRNRRAEIADITALIRSASLASTPEPRRRRASVRLVSEPAS